MFVNFSYSEVTTGSNYDGIHALTCSHMEYKWLCVNVMYERLLGTVMVQYDDIAYILMN